MIPSEVANQFYMKWKKLIRHVILANQVHVGLHQRAEVMAVHLRVSAYQDTLELHQIVVPNVLSTMIAQLDLPALIISAKTLVLALVVVSKIIIE